MHTRNFYAAVARHKSRACVSPYEFLLWAKRDVAGGDRRAIGNAVTNVKRALHARIDEILDDVRVRYTADWDRAERTTTKLSVLKRLGCSVGAIAKMLTEQRDILEHTYRLPSLDRARAAVETAELWLNRSAQGLSSKVLIAGFPTTSITFDRGKKTEHQSLEVEFTGRSALLFFWDSKRALIEVHADGTETEIPYSSFRWKTLVRRQEPFLGARWDGVPIPSVFATRLVRAYRRWLKQGGDAKFRTTAPASP